MDGIWLAGIVALVFAIAFGVVMRRLLRPSIAGELDPVWVQSFTVARYRPMERLLRNEDFEFLAAQPGSRPALVRKLRARRRQIFRSYLRSLKADFDKLHLAARIMLLCAPVDRPDIASALLRQTMLFQAAVYAIEVRLMLHWVNARPIDVSGLLDSMEWMQVQIRTLSAAPASAA